MPLPHASSGQGTGKSDADELPSDSLGPEQRTYMRRVGLPEPSKMTDAQKQMGVMASPEWEPAQAMDLGKSSSVIRHHHRFIGGTFDRGAGVYQDERLRHKRPSLVETGRHAGRSRVRFSNQEVLLFHQWTKDFFISAINTPLYKLVVIICLIYVATFFFFSAFWWIIVVPPVLNPISPVCALFTYKYKLSGGLTYVEIFMFSFITQQTIGYGNTGPNSCWGAAWLIIIQTLVGMIMDAITIGIIFARISHPKNRGRSIAISDSACIARRDGILKFMFRIADLRRTQVVEPKVKAYLYTWGAGRTTAEGEHIPVRIEELDIGYIDAMLILPLIIEHTVDERSPLCGHTHDSLMAVAAEVVVTFEGTTEFGNPFMARQSYLPSEIHWGCEFKRIIVPPKPNDTRYLVDVSQFHEVEAHAAVKADTPSKTSRRVVSNALRTVPFPLLGENTLVLSDHMCLAPDENGHMSIMFRVGDTYGGNQFVDVSVRAYIYRWRPAQKGVCGVPDDFEVKLLETGYSTGEDHLFLWLPVVCKHVIDDESPLRSWRTPGGFERDHTSAIAVVVEGWMYSNSQERMRLRIYNVKNSIRPGHGFAPMVTPPHETPELKPRIDWSKFHHMRPLTAAAAKQDAKIASQRQGSLQNPGMDDRPLVVPMGVNGMLGEATSEPSFHGARESFRLPEQDPPVQHDSPDPSAHARTWDSAKAPDSNQQGLGRLVTSQHAGSLAPGYAPHTNALHDSGHSRSLEAEQPVTSPFAAHDSDPFQDATLRPSTFLSGEDSLPRDAMRPADMRQPMHGFHGDAPIHDRPPADQVLSNMPNGNASIPEYGQALEEGAEGGHQVRRSSLGGVSRRSSEALTAYQLMFEGHDHLPAPDEETIPGTAVGSYSSTPEAGALSFMPHEDATSTFRKRTRGRPRVTFQQTKDMWEGQGEDSGHGGSGRSSGQPRDFSMRGGGGSSEQEQESMHARAQNRLAKLFAIPSTPSQHDRDLPV